mmetsp:Transcript_4336/g.6075  ORF Transcript_4336/g.6075 Transcript_4336/m.6075 type:complete len:97 (+) Transcript_4336:351-641(+)
MQSVLSKVVLRLASTTTCENSCVTLVAKRYKHTPSIKFTHGRINKEAAAQQQHHQTSNASGASSAPRHESSGNFSRFKRRAITEEEIRIVNLGGAS